jgi:hypothetical protein
MIAVEQGVQLEVLDWGGSGRPLIFLAGDGDTAHRFDNFAPQFTKQHHVYLEICKRAVWQSATPSILGSYSARNACIGSINAARLAGHKPANAQQPNSTITALAIVTPSSGFTS